MTIVGYVVRATHNEGVEGRESTDEPDQESELDPAATDEPDQESELAPAAPDDLNWNIPQWSMVPLMIAVVALMAWAFGADRVLWVLVPFSVLIGAVTVIDLRELRVPNRILLPASVVAIPLLIVAATSAWPEVSFWRALIGAAVMGAVYLTMGLIYPAGMGFGDIKFAPLVGAQLALFGWVPFVRGLLAAFLIVGPVAIILLLTKRARMGTGLPFAPFMSAGAVLALVLHARGIV